jgi:hypothetical protein
VSYADQIRTEANAKTMRGLIADGINENKSIADNASATASEAKTKVEANDNRIDNIVNAPVGKDLEVQDLRFDEINNIQYGSAGERVNKINASLNNIVQHSKEIFVSVIDFGAKPNDNTFDNKSAIQSAIDYVESVGGGAVHFPVGVFYINSTINMKEYVVLQGVSKTRRDGEGKGTVIKCNVATSVNKIVMLNFDGTQYTEYLYGGGLKNIALRGNEYTTGVYLKACSSTLFETVNILYHENGMVIEGGMLDSYFELSITHCYKKGLYIPNTRTTTTQSFYSCYIGQNHSHFSCVPLKVESYAAYDLKFFSLTLESNPNAVELGRAINVFIENLYIENSPSGSGTVVATSVFKVGVSNAADNGLNINHNTILHINGMIAVGSIAPYTTNTLFELDYCEMFSVRNGWYRRFGNVVTISANNKSIPQFETCFGESGLVTNDIDTLPQNKINIINCMCGTRGLVNRSVCKTYTVSLLNSWVAFGSGYSDFKVTKNISNVVSIEGTIKSGTTNVICILPSEIRPSGLVHGSIFAVYNSAWTTFPCTVGSDGTVTSQAPNVGLNTSLNIRYQL